jgi:hypothetical protein
MTPVVPIVPELPSWGDAGSVTLFVIAALGMVVSTLAVFHVAVPAGITQQITAGAGYIGAVVALVFNTLTHRSAHAKVAVAQETARVSSGTP